MRKRLLLLILLSCAAPLLRAQDGVGGTVLGWLRSVSLIPTKLSRAYDTTYVYRLDRPWVVSLDADLIWTGTQTRSETTPVGADTPQILTEGHLRHNAFQKVGVGLTYGSLQFAYTLEVGKKSAQRNRYTRFLFTQPHWGTSIQYYVVNDFLDGTRTDAAGAATPFSSQYPAQMRNFVADVFYFFTPGQLAYSAIGGGTLIQRRSGGSGLVRACYAQGQLQYDLQDALVKDSYDHVGRFRTGEITVSGGYSYNWVPLHRAPDGRGLRGLRNLTFNATVAPGVSVYNHLLSTTYGYSATGEPAEGRTTRSYKLGLPGVALAARAGFSFSWDRYILCTTVTYNRSAYRGPGSVSQDPQTLERYNTQTRGSFYDVTARLQLCVRF